MKVQIEAEVKKMNKEIETEMAKNAKHNANEMNKKAKELNNESKPQEASHEGPEGLSQAESRPALEALQPNTHTAVFEDRTEYLHQDGTKLIDRGNLLTIDPGRWSTPESRAALIVDAGAAKGWSEMSFSGSDEFVEYAEALAKARGIEVVNDELDDFNANAVVENEAEAEHSAAAFEPIAGDAVPAQAEEQQEHTQAPEAEIEME
ncbi:MAG: hypothetical protein GQ532_11845 [Methylomarinum sp.]|nr:hypothetical protein [Methylomarinum sp.]